eukprot:CAMPEP_0116919406 /NCGR_PEP_ID=MMETSP0467-20121206/20365_1 /TAXON_ID=283647 /ORGANISM="Mesodinium pulex, Strain SPMC105" /LENGTH=210 /DNA_ID=CAMNT_0004596975 /DNA_START=226 /DNA_END=858 /DNA_ORIENTATION=+
MDFLDAGLIKTLKEWNADHQSFSALFAPKNSKNIVTLDQLIQMCSHLFIKNTKDIKRIFLFTCEDSPSSNDEKTISIRKAHDLADSKVKIELFPLNFWLHKTVHQFKITKWYSDILLLDSELEDQGSMNNIDHLNSLLKKRAKPKRAVTSVEFQISESLSIGVSVYSGSKDESIPKSNANVNVKNNNLVVCDTTLVDAETRKPVDKTDIK